jgi:type III secretion protein T
LDSQSLWNLFAPILLALPRIGAAIVVAPLFPKTVFPTLVRGAIAVSLSLYLYPYMLTEMPATAARLVWIALLGKEVLLGSLLGLAVGTLLWALQCAGATIDYQTGMSNAQIFDPFGGHQGGPMGQLMIQLGTVLLVAAGGLQVLAGLLFESFQLWPVVSFYPATGHLAELGSGWLGSVTELMVRLAAPLVLILALVDLGFGLVGRVVPQLNTFFFTMPVKGALSALMLALYVSYLSDIAVAQVGVLQHWLEHLRALLSGH